MRGLKLWLYRWLCADEVRSINDKINNLRDLVDNDRELYEVGLTGVTRCARTLRDDVNELRDDLSELSRDLDNGLDTKADSDDVPDITDLTEKVESLDTSVEDLQDAQKEMDEVIMKEVGTDTVELQRRMHELEDLVSYLMRGAA